MVPFLHHLFILSLFTINPTLSTHLGYEFSILGFDSDAFNGVVHSTPPESQPPTLPPLSPPEPYPASVSCEGLNASGSFDTSCELSSSLSLENDVYIHGKGSFFIHPGVNLTCPHLGCSIVVNVSGEFSLGKNSVIIAGLVLVNASNASLFTGSVINVTAMAGEPPPMTSDTPGGVQGAGGGHGGRGASCVRDNTKLPDDYWGGDPYAWSSLEEPKSYGSKGGSTSKEAKYGGEGGGRIWLEARNAVVLGGTVLADGGDGGIKGGGGSGGSIYIKGLRMYVL